MQHGTGNSYLPTGNYVNGGSLGRPDLLPIDVTPSSSHGTRTPYVQGSEQRTSQPINLSLPAQAILKLENSANRPSAALASSGSCSVSSIGLNSSYTVVSDDHGQDLGSTSVGNNSLQNQLCSCGRIKRNVLEEASENVLHGENELYSNQVEYCNCRETPRIDGSSGSLGLPVSASAISNAMLPNEATSNFFPSRTMTYPAHSSRIIYGAGPHVNGTSTYHASIIPRTAFSYSDSAGFLTNTLAPVLPIMHAPSFSVPWPQFPWNWTYSSISFQVPFMYPVNETIGYEVIPHQHSLPFIPTFQLPHVSQTIGYQVFPHQRSLLFVPTSQFPHVSQIYHASIIRRNPFSYWIPGGFLTNILASVLPIMHAASFSVPWQQFPWNWTYSLISFQVPFMYPVNETIGYEVIPHQHSLPFVPTYQFPDSTLDPAAERIATRENMVNANFAVQQASFPLNHTPRFAGVNHGPGLPLLHPYNFQMAQNAIPPTFNVDVDNMSYEGLWAFQAQVGHVSRGLSKEVIVARMKCTKYESTEGSANDNDNDVCCICLEGFSDGQLIGRVECRHSFHFDCMCRWLMEKNICPLCNGIALKFY